VLLGVTVPTSKKTLSIQKWNDCFALLCCGPTLECMSSLSELESLAAPD